ncbi:hypothetical protein [Mesorhizobium sp. M0037]|uniref:hypothetical protein n=1 Tax=unclassified Mesorhizobium TaxID=325217 RepID=UPI00333BE517
MTNTEKTLGDVLYDFALAMPAPDPAVLDEFAKLYPEYADVLTDFAVQLALGSGADDEDEGSADDPISPAVSRAVSHFHNVAYELDRAATGGRAEAVENPFATLSRESFRAFVAKIDASSVFVMKLRDRQIEPDTIESRPGFCQTFADELHVPTDALLAHFRGPQTLTAQQHFKADEKPTIPKRETFEEAVRNSGLTPEQQKRLLEM